MNDSNVILNSFILSKTRYSQPDWDNEKSDLETQHVMFMEDGWDGYVDKMLEMVK